jgi:hypothetical protein
MSVAQSRTELMKRCLARLEQVITVEERIKILRVLASTALTMATDLEINEVTTTA